MSEYFPVAFTFAVAALVVGVMVSLNSILGPRPPRSAVKDETFECGNPPTGDAWHRFSIKFYLVAILFIIFDLEVAFLFPWAVSLGNIGLLGFWSMMIFLGVLTIGFVYEWKKGALEWE